MFIETGSGKTIAVSVEQYLAMNESDLNAYRTEGIGFVVTDPAKFNCRSFDEKYLLSDDEDEEEHTKELTELTDDDLMEEAAGYYEEG